MFTIVLTAAKTPISKYRESQGSGLLASPASSLLCTHGRLFQNSGLPLVQTI